ncbi:MAG: hypothetical protein ACYTG1_07740 [Planctomycetota bacterium]|jgi:hypothetical protein
MNASIDALHERVRRLERANRRQRRLLTTAGLVLATAAGLSAGPQDDPGDPGIPAVIQARSFEVVDEAGRPLVHLFSTLGVGAIGTSDVDGNLLVAVAAERTRSGFVGAVTTLNTAGNELVKLGAEAAGQGTVGTFDGDGTGLVRIGVTDSGHGGIVTSTAGGEPRVEIGAGGGGHGAVVAYAAGGLASAQLAATDGGGIVSVGNYAGLPVSTMDVDDRGHGRIEILDRTGKGRVIRARW